MDTNNLFELLTMKGLFYHVLTTALLLVGASFAVAICIAYARHTQSAVKATPLGNIIKAYYSSHSYEASAPKNLIPNPSLELQASKNTPLYWNKGNGGGDNTITFTYPVKGYDGKHAARLDIHTLQSGDAKWYFSPVSVRSATYYNFSDTYQSNIPSYITVECRMSNGTVRYIDIAELSPTTTWANIHRAFEVPKGTTSLTIFHLIKKPGWLITDNYSLTQAESTR